MWRPKRTMGWVWGGTKVRCAEILRMSKTPEGVIAPLLRRWPVPDVSSPCPIRFDGGGGIIKRHTPGPALFAMPRRRVEEGGTTIYRLTWYGWDEGIGYRTIQAVA